jgi:hypothetical protein
MMRSLPTLLTLAGLVVILSNGPLAAEGKGDKAAGKKGSQTLDATIVTVDPKKHEITVTLHEGKDKESNKEKGKDKESSKEKGKDKESNKEKGNHKHYQLTETVKIVDASGNVITLEVFKKGDEVKIVEIEGKISELHHMGAAKK